MMARRNQKDFLMPEKEKEEKVAEHRRKEK